jgi:hypothetical protein
MSEQPVRDKATRRSEVEALLREEDKASLAGSLGRFLKGAGICFVIGFVFATVLKLVVGWSWFGWLFSFLLVMAGIVLWRQRGPVTVDLNKGRQETNTNRGITSIIFGGPLAAIEGLRGMRGHWTSQQHAAFDRAAVLVFDLAKVDGGMPVKDVLHPPEDMQTFGLAVDWLDSNDWIGQATGGGSLWLSTVGRRKLVSKNLMPPPGDFEILS